MKCRDAQQRLSVSLDTEIDAVQNHHLRRHLVECENCRRFAADLSRLGRSLSRWDAPEPHPEFADRVMADLGVEPEESSWLREWLEALRPVGAAAAMIALICGIALAVTMDGEPSGPVAVAEDPVETFYAESFELVPNDSVAGRYLALLEEREE